MMGPYTVRGVGQGSAALGSARRCPSSCAPAAQVFGIVALQLAVTVAFSFACLFVNPIKVRNATTWWRAQGPHVARALELRAALCTDGGVHGPRTGRGPPPAKRNAVRRALLCAFAHLAQTYVRSTPWPFYLSWGLSFGLLLVISCNEHLRRRSAG